MFFVIKQFLDSFMPYLLAVLVPGAVLALAIEIVRSGKQLLDETISHWHKTLHGVSISPSEFYDRVEQKVSSFELPGVQFQRVNLSENWSMSWKRSYLRVTRLDFVYDIGLYPFAGGVYVSSWLREPVSTARKILLHIPVVRAIVRGLTPKTYFKVDAAICFQEVTHTAVLAVLDEVTNIEGATPIPDQERKPVMRELYMGNIGFVGPRAPALQ